jgi:hypothetical protein
MVFLSDLARQKMNIYVQLAEGEISGLGEVEVVNKHNFVITDIFLLKQKCTINGTLLDRLDISRFLFERIQDGGNPATIKLWWHSHADIGVFWSADDEQTIDGFKNKWMVSVVTNRAGNMLARVDVYEPIRVTEDNLGIRLILPENEELRAKLDSEVKEKVTFTSPPVFPGADFYFQNLPVSPTIPHKKTKRR